MQSRGYWYFEISVQKDKIGAKYKWQYILHESGLKTANGYFNGYKCGGIQSTSKHKNKAPILHRALDNIIMHTFPTKVYISTHLLLMFEYCYVTQTYHQ